MPDGSRVPTCTLPRTLVDQAERAFGRMWPHPYVSASVAWMMFLREDDSADLVEVARHYALWCWDKTYYAAISRMRL